MTPFDAVTAVIRVLSRAFPAILLEGLPGFSMAASRLTKFTRSPSPAKPRYPLSVLYMNSLFVVVPPLGLNDLSVFGSNACQAKGDARPRSLLLTLR